MKYNEKEFNDAVEYYKKKLQKKSLCALITFSINNKKAFFSLAPLSRAMHELSCDVSCIGYGKKKDSIDVLNEIWQAYGNLKEGKNDEKTAALGNFIKRVEGKIPDFKNLFEKPDLIINAEDNRFSGDIELDYKDGWMKEYRTEELNQTAKILWKEVYNIKDEEDVSVGFELIPVKAMLGHPLEDYLDSYPISWAMVSKCNGKVSMGASTSRPSMLDKANRISDLRTTLLGNELEKDIDEEPFMTFKALSEKMNLRRLKPADASFFISGKGYPGKHAFGDKIGYPSPNKKTRWKSPGQFIYKFDFVPQTKYEERDPMSRVAFTDTLPIDIFIETNLVDWTDIRNRNQKVKDIMDRCEKIFVKGKLKEKHVTNLEVGLIKKDGTRRWVKRSDTDVREKLNREYLEKTGIRAGCMGNIPGGEAFVTPEYIKGIFVGDVVIAIDQSYPLTKEAPFVVECYGNDYKVLTAPKKILQEFNRRKDEAWQLLEESEKEGSLPKEIIDMKKRNFNNIGEFAINTNPKARLCEYLIVNEKIAKMMHIALGSGYEEDRSTDYHMDIVFDAPRQKLDVYGIDKAGKEHWILRNGEFDA